MSLSPSTNTITSNGNGNGNHIHNDIRQSSSSSSSWAFLPKPTLPPREEFQPIEKFVADAILSRHHQDGSNNNNNDDNNTTTTAAAAAAATAASSMGYKAILDLIRKKDDIPMLLISSSCTNILFKSIEKGFNLNI